MRKIIILLASLALAACGQNAPATQPTTIPTAVTIATAAPTATSAAAPVATAVVAGYPAPGYPAPAEIAAPAELVQAAQARLATKLGIQPATLIIQKGESMQWPDESLGCPAPGASYQPITIPGYLLTFSDSSRSYAIHTSLSAAAGEPMIWCENQQPTDLAAAAAPPTPDAQGQAMFELAKQDLAKQISADPASITLADITPVEWNDSSLGCPKPGVNYMQVITPGYLLRLEVKGTSYEYHTDTRNIVVMCLP